MRGKRECSCGGGAVVVHDSFVVRQFEGVVVLDTVYEDLADPFHLVLDRQAEKSRESRKLNVSLEEERPRLKVEREMVRSMLRLRRSGNSLVIEERREKIREILSRIVEANDRDAIDRLF